MQADKAQFNYIHSSKMSVVADQDNFNISIYLSQYSCFAAGISTWPPSLTFSLAETRWSSLYLLSACCKLSEKDTSAQMLQSKDGHSLSRFRASTEISGSPHTFFSTSCQVSKSSTACGTTFSRPACMAAIWRTDKGKQGNEGKGDSQTNNTKQTGAG